MSGRVILRALGNAAVCILHWRMSGGEVGSLCGRLSWSARNDPKTEKEGEKNHYLLLITYHLLFSKLASSGLAEAS